MGEFRFRTPTDWQLPTEVAATIHIVGLDGIPWPCKVQKTDAELVISRNREESGKTYLGYQTKRFGRLMLCTGSLLANEAYDLMIEIARGTLNRARQQVSNWDEGGLQIDPRIHDQIQEATRFLGTALMSGDVEQRDQLAQASIDLTLESIFDVSDSFGQQVASYRREHPDVDNFWMARTSAPGELLSGDVSSVEAASGDGAQLDPQHLVSAPFDKVRVLPEQLDQLTNDAGSSVIVGPFLDVSPGGMSQSLIECDDFRSRHQQVINGTRNALKALPANVSMLHLISGVNGLGHRHLNYAQQLQVATEMLNVVDEMSIETPTMVSFDFPWAERLAGAVGGIHPLQVADSLLRQGARVSHLGLEMNLDYGVTGSAFRDPLQWIDLIDVWAQLGLPLVICLRMPTQVPTDADFSGRDRSVSVPGNSMTDEQRFNVLNTVVPMMAARPAVAGLLWQQWHDDGDRRFPYGGLVATDGAEKPIVDRLRTLRTRV